MQVPANRDNPAVGVFSSGTLAPTRVECAEKPCAGEFPIALYGDGGYTEHIGDFLLSQSGEEAQFYNLRGQGEEVGPSLPRNRLGRSKEPEVQLVDEGRGLQRVVGAFLPEIMAGQQPQLLV